MVLRDSADSVPESSGRGDEFRNSHHADQTGERSELSARFINALGK